MWLLYFPEPRPLLREPMPSLSVTDINRLPCTKKGELRLPLSILPDQLERTRISNTLFRGDATIRTRPELCASPVKRNRIALFSPAFRVDLSTSMETPSSRGSVNSSWIAPGRLLDTVIVCSGFVAFKITDVLSSVT